MNIFKENKVIATFLVALLLTLSVSSFVVAKSGANLNKYIILLEIILVYFSSFLIYAIGKKYIAKLLILLFQLVLALQCCSIYSTDEFIIPMTVANLGSAKAIGFKELLKLAGIFLLCFMPSCFILILRKQVKEIANIKYYLPFVFVFLITPFFINGVLLNTVKLSKAVYSELTYRPSKSIEILNKYHRDSVVMESSLNKDDSFLFNKNDFKNIIVVFIEGMSQEVIDRFNNKNLNVTPNLDRLVDESFFIDNYFNHTAATFRGLRGQLYSTYQRTAGYYSNKNQGLGTMSKAKMNRVLDTALISLPDILGQHHYHSYFFSNEWTNGNMTLYLSHFGFSKVFSSTELGWNTNTPRTDRFAFESLQRTLEEGKIKKPFFAGIYSCETHHGVDSSDKKYGNGENSYYNKFYNLDYYLGKFVNWFRKSSFYEDTILIITSDHVTFPTEQFNRSFGISQKYFAGKIPLLILGKNVKSGFYNAKGKTSLAFAPTVLDLLGFRNDSQYFLGCSLFEEKCQCSYWENKIVIGGDNFQTVRNGTDQYFVELIPPVKDIDEIYSLSY